ncbi:MAG: hypothetical protein KJ614_11025 [Gammaproteobacteria bacterium]|uniref:mechanosensitive ion channel family protein n=1 Tax=Rhodoferax sp. TaxID=50421 RepID=UPI0017BA4311|nr:hypothetical protein [Rhodoferax sp.]MBU3899443.1 hypothetical protein [Gammaproteobacteria bacterium]MBA3057257.1 hypothetical protein [Rhodoferax sp.]MBU3996347.1 hypothetical protein [Gammaproteobacteria bacterium]MBU4080698.1 hypothetical protein [Gammaproteobacteria bacterium]MBU4113512.1 hypothetical protein [Gammaproteobacteria bacterium]
MPEFLNLILSPLQEVWLNFQVFLPNLLAMLVILLLGLVLAKLIRIILVKALNAINFDSLCDRVGITALMRKGDLWTKPAVALATVVFWLLIVVTLMIALSALRLPTVDHMVTQFFGYLPRAFSAALILIVGFLLAGFISRAVLIAAVNSAYHYAKLLAEAVRMLLTVLILAMAMEQLQVAPSIVLAAFSIIFGGIVIALAIAFGVGGIDAARRMIERENATDQKDEIEHL